MSTLYLVATPIGNLDDITRRALDVLATVDIVAAEDTRTVRRMLDHFAVQARLTSYNDHNKRLKTPQLLDALARGDVAVVSEAGMPGISDPGHDLVVAALAAGHRVVPVPGASAVVAAVAASGLPSRRFHYLGFLPRQSGARRSALRDSARCGDTLVLFESPHRLVATLADALAVLGDRRIAVCRELTKIYEEIWRGPLTGAIAHFAAPRGEFTLVIEGGPSPADGDPDVASDAAVEQAIADMRAHAVPARSAIARLSKRFALSRRDAYRRWHADERGSERGPAAPP